MSSRGGVEDDNQVRAALDWLRSVATPELHLEPRMRIARDYYRVGSVPDGSNWPETSRLVLPGDPIASYLAQADSLLHDWRTYDLALGARIIPFLHHVGKTIDFLATMPGGVERARRLLKPKNEHPNATLYELAVAGRYAHEGYDVQFVPESSVRTGDLRVKVEGLNKDVQVECKRLRSSRYELRETANVRALFEPLSQLIHEKRLNIHVDLRFTSELPIVPRNYLVTHVMRALESPFSLFDGYPWKDEYGEGVVRRAQLDRVHDDIRDTYLLYGPKMARLLTGRVVPEGGFLMSADASPSIEDPRYVDTVRYASVLTWQCSAPESIEARARHILSKLNEIDRQLKGADMGIAHIGMEVERDTETADLRHARNLAAVRSFRPASRLLEVHLHYYLPHVTETAAWTMDETIDSNSVLPMRLLADARIFFGAKEIDEEGPAWRLPPPHPPT